LQAEQAVLVDPPGMVMVYLFKTCLLFELCLLDEPVEFFVVFVIKLRIDQVGNDFIGSKLFLMCIFCDFTVFRNIEV